VGKKEKMMHKRPILPHIEGIAPPPFTIAPYADKDIMNARLAIWRKKIKVNFTEKSYNLK